MVHPGFHIHNRLHRPLADVLAVEVVAVAVLVAVEVVAVDVAALAEAGDLLVLLRLVVCMTDKCGSTTAYIVLHNSMNYYKLDIGSLLFLHPSKRVNSKNNTSIKT